MNRRSQFKTIFIGGLLAMASSSQSLLACAACFGKSDSRLAVGMNWGIFVLLGVVSFVLCGFAAFGVFLAKRSAMTALPTPPAVTPQATEKV